MGQLIEGIWHDQWYDTSRTGGRFERTRAQFRHWITHDGSAGPSGDTGFLAQAGRYHLYVSLACPWAHRTLIFRQLKQLQEIIPISVVHPYMGNQGWTFAPSDGVIPDPHYKFDYAHQLYTQADASYSGRVTVPILWDTQRQTIVSNESADIIRMFNSAFDDLTGNALNFYPQALHQQIDTINDDIYQHINNGVYRAGFATTQAAYEEAVSALFAQLDVLEQRLSIQPYLVGEILTEADWRLFTTLIRFDAVYVGHFKCNLKRIADYPHLHAYLQRLYSMEGIAQTVNIEHIKAHYYTSHPTINPTGVIPSGPALAFG
ncbi:MAG: glutathione S-transferase family protein [Pseudomonadales bacterium]